MSMDNFAPRKYLEHYWPATHLDDECEFILTFLHEAHALFAASSSTDGGVRAAAMVEVGGGPVIDKLMSASRHVAEIYHLDPSAAALNRVRVVCEAYTGDPLLLYYRSIPNVTQTPPKSKNI